MSARWREGYAAMRAAYTRMFQRMGLNFRTVQADTGAIGGSASEEFQVLAASGEDAIAISDADDFAANVELAPALPPTAPRAPPAAPLDARRHPGRAHHRAAQRAARDPRRALPEDPDRRGQRRHRRWRCCCAAITSSMRSRRRSCPALPTRCAWRAPPRCRPRPAARPDSSGPSD